MLGHPAGCSIPGVCESRADQEHRRGLPPGDSVIQLHDLVLHVGQQAGVPMLRSLPELVHAYTQPTIQDMLHI